jgi:hypothetical protein
MSLKYLAFCLFLVAVPLMSSAYEVETHSLLTKNIAAEYLRLGGTLSLTASDVELMAGGAVHEDEMRTGYQNGYGGATRPLNHFFDPVNNRGITKAGVELGLPSPRWAVDTKVQANYDVYALAPTARLFTGVSDYSWDRAVYEYVHGDKQRAIATLGHTLHLLEDATSPAHTRNDAHSCSWLDGCDPYETYTRVLVPHVAVSPLQVPTFTTADQAVYATASYTNANFFSRDTINDFRLPDKKLFKTITVGLHDYLENGNAKILISDKHFDKDVGEDIFLYLYPEADRSILQSNWEVLSAKAVTNGVGLVQLFERAVANERRTQALLQRNVSATTGIALNDSRTVVAMLGGSSGFAPANGSQIGAASEAVFGNVASLAPATVELSVPPPPPVPTPTPQLSSTQTVTNILAPDRSKSFPVSVAFTHTPALPLSPVPSVIIPPTPQSTPSNPGKLSSLAFGSGAGGGGSGSSASAPTTVTPEEVPVVVSTITPPPIIPILCTLPQTHDASTNTCVLVVPICTTLETLDTTTNTCLPKPIPPVVCTTPEIPNPSTSSGQAPCIVPPQTGPTLLPSVFTEDTILTYALSPYTSDPQRDPKMTIKPGVTVTVEPGVTIAMHPGTRFLVEGTLRMQGTSTYPIRTTSICDTTVTPALITPPCSPTALPWVGITITPTGTLAAAHTTFIYGGWLPNGPYASDWPFATINNSGTLTFTNTTISTSHSAGVIHSGTSFTSTNLTLDTATTGLAIHTGGYDVTNTHIANTTFSAVTLGSLIGKITNTTGTNNSQNGITFSSPEISPNQTAHLYPNAISYFTYYDLSILGTLVVHKGVFVQNVQNVYTIGATGRITTPQDELGAPPVFTSVWNNAQTNEPRGTIVGTTPVIPKVGDWKGFVVQEGGVVDAAIEKKYNKF